MGKPRFPHTSVILPPELRQEINSMCQDLHISFSKACEIALNQWLIDVSGEKPNYSNHSKVPDRNA